MALRKYKPSNDAPPLRMAPLNFSNKAHEKAEFLDSKTDPGPTVQSDIDIDLREVYFLIMHFLSVGPCIRTYGQFWNELLEHQFLPRRHHAWYSRSGAHSGDENDNDSSLPLSYNKLVERYPHIETDHLVKLLKQLISSTTSPLHGMPIRNSPNAADVPTLLGSGSFSLLRSGRDREDKKISRPPSYECWPHMPVDQVRGLSLREIGGGFAKHHCAPSICAACYAIAKPSTMVQKMQDIKKLRGHRDAVYCDYIFWHTMSNSSDNVFESLKRLNGLSDDHKRRKAEIAAENRVKRRTVMLQKGHTLARSSHASHPRQHRTSSIYASLGSSSSSSSAALPTSHDPRGRGRPTLRSQHPGLQHLPGLGVNASETHLPELKSRGMFLSFMDMDGSHVWQFIYRYCPNCTGRMYLLENTGEYVKFHNLQVGLQNEIVWLQACNLD